MSEEKKNAKRIKQAGKPNGKKEEAKPTDTPPYVETNFDKFVAFVIAIYTLVVFVIAMLSMLAIWPRTPAELALNVTRSITFPIGLGSAVAVGPETLLAATMVLAGIIGACVFSLYAISLHLGPYKDFDRAWTAWYILRPPIGAGMAFIVYVLVRSGILTVGASLNNLNLLGLSGMSFLVGLFTEHAMTKLLDLADTTFGATPDQKSASNASKDKAQKA